mgnify:CR=1 FL=1
MSETEIVKMSTKGQLVVPEQIRKEEDFKAGDRFVPLPVNEVVLFKRIKIPDVKKEFAKIAKEIEAKFKKQKITSKHVKEAVKWARRA